MLPFPSVLFAAAAVASAPGYATNESLAEQTTTDPSLTGAAITETLEANTDYLFVWSVDVQSSSTSSVASADIELGGVSIFTQVPALLPREGTDPIDYNTMGGVFRYQSGASPAPTTFTMKAVRGANPATLKCRNSRLSYVKLGADDEYAESIALQTFLDPANKTAQTAATLSFTPPSAGDYTILAFFNANLDNTSNVTYGYELTDGTTTTTELLCRPFATSDRCPTVAVLPLVGISGAKTISLKIRQTGTGTTPIGVSEIRIFAIRNDRFASVRSTTLGTTSNGAEGAYTTVLSQTFTPTAGDHLSLASWQSGSSSTSISTYSQFLDDALTVNEHIREYGVGVTTSGVGSVSHQIAAYAAASRTQALQRKSETTDSNAIQKGSTIICFELTGI